MPTTEEATVVPVIVTVSLKFASVSSAFLTGDHEIMEDSVQSLDTVEVYFLSP